MGGLPVFWWRGLDGGVNLGDELTSILLTEFFGVPNKLSPFDSAALLGAGSILGWTWARANVDSRVPDPKLSVVGSGFMHPRLDAKELDFLKIYSVRGFLSRSVLPDGVAEGVSIGDPGLLVSRLAKDSPVKTTKYGIIPHISFFDRDSFRERFDALDLSVYIDFRTSDLKAVMREMQSCDVILSQSLHGLIIADSLGIPNVWIDHGALHPGAEFKFYDYFSSVGRDFEKVIARSEQISDKEITANAFVLPDRRLAGIQDNIIQAFASYFADFGITGTRSF